MANDKPAARYDESDIARIRQLCEIALRSPSPQERTVRMDAEQLLALLVDLKAAQEALRSIKSIAYDALAETGRYKEALDSAGEIAVKALGEGVKS